MITLRKVAPEQFSSFCLSSVTLLCVAVSGLSLCSYGITSPFSLGVFVGTTGFTSIWISLGPGPFWRRILYWTGSWLIWTLILVAPLILVISPDAAMELLGIAMMTPMLCLISQIPIITPRFLYGWRIVDTCDLADRPFGVGSFLYATAVSSVFLLLFQQGWKISSLEWDWKLAISLSVVYASLTIFLPGVFLGFYNSSGPPQIGIFAGLSQIVVLVGGFVWLGWLVNREGWDDYFLIALTIWIVAMELFWLGIFLTLWLICFISGYHGFQLVSSGSRSAEVVFGDVKLAISGRLRGLPRPSEPPAEPNSEDVFHIDS